MISHRTEERIETGLVMLGSVLFATVYWGGLGYIGWLVLVAAAREGCK